MVPLRRGGVLLRPHQQPGRSRPAAVRRALVARLLRGHGEPLRDPLPCALHVRLHALRRGAQERPGRVRANWAPASAPPVLRQLIWVIHAVSEVFRVVSLSVRLFANMLAGHAILAVFFGMALLFQNYAAAALLQGGSVLIYLFELFVAFIQAFIFAILSGVYIGGALDQEH
ncbi:MAG: F0F1 ATP synthase subunit A [Actinomycetota bacterium]|nr:MAG: F0F1 ATP synthase subunit A [Actinomycetota bacterium]